MSAVTSPLRPAEAAGSGPSLNPDVGLEKLLVTGVATRRGGRGLAQLPGRAPSAHVAGSLLTGLQLRYTPWQQDSNRRLPTLLHLVVNPDSSAAHD